MLEADPIIVQFDFAPNVHSARILHNVLKSQRSNISKIVSPRFSQVLLKHLCVGSRFQHMGKEGILCISLKRGDEMR